MATFGDTPANAPTSESIVSGLVSGSAAATANTAIIQAAIDAATLAQAGSSFGAVGSSVVLPPGSFYVNDTLTIADVYGLKLSGTAGATFIKWSGANNTKPVLLLSHCRNCEVSDLLFHMSTSAAYAAVQCRRDDHEGATISPSANNFTNVFVDGTGHIYAFVIGGAGSVDANNDFNVFNNCTATGYTEAGYLLTGTQSFNNLFYNCWAVHTGANYGVYTGSNGASLVWDGGAVGGHVVADFQLGRSGFPQVAKNFNSEGSQHVLEIIDELYTHITLDNFRWSGNAKTGGGAMIKTNLTTPRAHQLKISNARMGDSSGSAALTIPINLSAAGALTLTDSTLITSAADPFPNSKPTNNPAYAGNVLIPDESNIVCEKLTW